MTAPGTTGRPAGARAGAGTAPGTGTGAGGEPPPVAIDVHVHPSTQEYLVDALGPYREAAEAHFRTSIPVRTVEEMAAELRADRVLAVLLAWDTTSASGLPPVTNDFVADCAQRHPDAFLGFASVDPWQGRAAVAELRRAVVDLDLRGLKLHPSAQDFSPDDRRFYDLYAACAELEVPVLFHTGTTGLGAGMPGGGGIKLGHSRPVLLDTVAADFPELQIVAAHPSWPWQDEMLAVAQHKTNVWIDLSGWSPRRWSPALRDAVLGPLSDRALFGTDYPFITFARWRKAFLAHEPSDEVVERVLRANAARLLGLDLRLDPAAADHAAERDAGSDLDSGTGSDLDSGTRTARSARTARTGTDGERRPAGR